MKSGRVPLVSLLLLAGALTFLCERAVRTLIDRALSDRFIDRVTLQSEHLAASLAAGWPRTAAEAERRVQEASRWLRVRTTLLDAGGRVVADSELGQSDLAALAPEIDQPEIRQADSDGMGHALRPEPGSPGLALLVARKVRLPDSSHAFIRFAVDEPTLLDLPLSLRLGILAVIAVTMLLFAAIAHARMRALLRPARRIRRSIDRITEGDLSRNRGDRESGPLGELQSAVETMRGRLRERLERTEEDRQVLASILGGLREGILVVDSERRLVLMNESMKRIQRLDRDVPPGSPIIEVVWDRVALDAFDEALSAHDKVSRRIRFPAGRSFELTVVPFPGVAGGREGAIGLFFDVTRLEALERVRRDFVGDISHEVRTPLASVKASAETLLAGAISEPDEAVRFLGILTKNVGRLEMLLEDLTDLSRIETGAVSLSWTRLMLHPIVDETIAALASYASERKVTITNNVPAGFRVTADRRRLDQILLNLIDNAVKFNREGGRVEISALRDRDTPSIIIEDTGPGIPPDALRRVFNRFYRVDRARSQDVPGTGLGLAIVKHLVRLHGGDIRAENRVPSGSRFTVTLPDAGLSETAS